MFYKDTLVDVLFRGLDVDRKSSRCLPNTSTFVPKKRNKNGIAGYDATVERLHCCRHDRRVCGRQHRQDEPLAMGGNEGCVVLLSHEYALGRACQVACKSRCRMQRSPRQEGHQQTAVQAVCAKVASSCPRKRKLLTHDDKELLTRRSCSNRMQMQRTMRTSCLTRRSCGEIELRRELSPQSVLGECDLSHMKKLTLLGNVSP